MLLEKAGISLAKKLCKDDPVRKNIPYDWRVDGPNREIFHLEERAVICVAVYAPSFLATAGVPSLICTPILPVPVRDISATAVVPIRIAVTAIGVI